MKKVYLEGTTIEDLRGKRFGKLVVIDVDWDRYQRNNIRKNAGEIRKFTISWICKCDCGKYSSVGSCNFKSGDTSSCGLCYTFEDWCKDNNHQDYLDLWDYELNDKKPSEISYGVNKNYWFKCSKGIHKSELSYIANYTKAIVNGGKKNGSKISCRACNSFGQYLLDTYGNLEIWSDENKIDPFEVSKCSNKSAILICKDCMESKSVKLNNFINYGIGCSCGDGHSYPNKFMYDFLKQVNLEYINEYTFEWSNGKRYDIYIPSLNCIIENHGEQHYKGWWGNKENLEVQMATDKLKEEMAMANGIDHYIVLDCSKSTVDWIKYNIINSKLNSLIKLDEFNIDWMRCGRYATKNLIKEVCDSWDNNGSEVTAIGIAEKFNINRNVIVKYLKKGASLGWCDYDADEEKKKRGEMQGKSNGRRVGVFYNGEMIYQSYSVSELCRVSESVFNVKFSLSMVSKTCRGKIDEYKGFVFKYI